MFRRIVSAMLTLTLDDFVETRERIAPHIKHTPLLTSRQLSERDRVRRPAQSRDVPARRVVQDPRAAEQIRADVRRRKNGAASCARRRGITRRAWRWRRRFMGFAPWSAWPTNATPAKVAATKGYGAEVVLHGIDLGRGEREGEGARADGGLTYVHPFDDAQLIAGQGTLGLEIVQDWPEVDAVVVPIGGGGLISGVSMAVKSHNPKVARHRRRIVGRAGDAAQRRGGQARDDRLQDDHRRACACGASAS